MKSSFENAEKPDFSLLSSIMERFNQVPYEQFQQELNYWFKSNMSEYASKLKNREHFDGESDFTEKVISLGTEIFKEHEN